MRVRPNFVKRFIDRASGASETYVEGVLNPRKDWAKSTLEAEGNYESGIQKSISNKSFGKGVRRAGSEKQKKGVVEKGASRYPLGIQASEADYARGIAPYIQALEGLTLPLRGPKGDPRNLQRVKAVNDALMKKKREIRG